MRPGVRVLLLLALVAVSGCGLTPRAGGTAEPPALTSVGTTPAAVAAAAAPAPPGPLAREPLGADEQLARMANDLRDLQNPLARLSAGSRERQNQLQALDRRVAELTARLSPAVSTPPGFAPSAGSGLPPPTRSTKATSAEELYRLGTAQLEAGDSAGALLVLHELIASDPAHPLREPAQFSVGDILYAEKNYEGARAEFQSLLAALPYGSRTPEALLKIGLCERGLRNEAAARGVWQRLVKEHAGSAAAGRARALLREGRAR